MIKIAIGTLAVIVTVFFGCSKGAEPKIEFLSPYQAASTATPDGGVDVAIWWIPVRLMQPRAHPPGENKITNATVRVRWHGKATDHDVWWADMNVKATPETELTPGKVRMINLVARRAVDDDRAWYGVLLDSNLMAQIDKAPTARNESVRFPAGTDQRVTVTVVAGNQTIGSKDYIVHVPPDKEHNTRFWLQEPSTLNW